MEQNLKFRAGRRLKSSDLKTSEYANYVTGLDSFGKKNQSEVPKRMQPIFDEYLQNYLAATGLGDKDQERQIIGWFSSQVSALMREGLKDMLKLKSEFNRLKLIATDEMLQIFDKLEQLTQESMGCTNEDMKNFTKIFFINSTKNRSFSKPDCGVGI